MIFKLALGSNLSSTYVSIAFCRFQTIFVFFFFSFLPWIPFEKWKKKISFHFSYRLMIVYCAILSYLGMHTRWGCSRWGVRGWGCRMHPSSPLWHKKSSVCPPQFDAVICHASNNLGVWRLFKLLQDELNLFDTFFRSNNEFFLFVLSFKKLLSK